MTFPHLRPAGWSPWLAALLATLWLVPLACASSAPPSPTATNIPEAVAPPVPGSTPEAIVIGTPEADATPPAPSVAPSVAPTATTAPSPGSPSPASPTATTTPTVPPTATTVPAPQPVDPSRGLLLTLAPESVARYLVTEQFARRNFPNDAVGETSELTGSIALDPNGGVLPDRSRFTVNVRSLRSDEDDRDDFLRENALETDRFPEVMFVVQEAPGLPWPLSEGSEVQFQLAGSMTVHGVTSPVTWEVTARNQGDQVFGLARTNFPFDKFDMEKPSVFFLLSVEDNIRLELDFIAQLSPLP